MIRKITLLFLLCLSIHNYSFAQACATDKMERHLALQNPAAYAQKISESTQRWVAAHSGSLNPITFLLNDTVKRVYQIPIAVHIITTGGAIGTIYNPTDAQINSLVTYLNKTYNGTWPAYPDSVTGGTSIPLQYVLAKRDSNCSPTTGIDRVDGSSVPNYATGGINAGSGTGADEVAVKNLDRWPLNEYYNVWVVNKIDGKDGTDTGEFTAGYAYLAQATDPSVDGIVMLATQTNQGDITFPHELGHAMSLLHVFEGNDPNSTGANNCPANNNCLTDGDQICDTQPEMQSQFDCPTDPNPCTGISYNFVQHNFMDYSSCQDRFTAGQRARIIWGLMTYRQVLLGSAGVLSPDTLAAATTCVPTILNPNNSLNAGPQEVKISDTYISAYIGAAYTYLDYPSGGYNDDGNNVYLDMTCKQQANLVAGNSYKFFVKTGQSPNGEKVRVYIDFNGDGVFSPSAGELIYSHDGNIGNQMDSVVYTLPTSATMPTLKVNQPLRMRVISDNSSVTTVDSCGPIGYGQAEDYSVLISGPAGPAVDSVAITLPQGEDTTCAGTSLTFTATPNAGAVNVTYNWYVNNISTGVTTNTYTADTLSDGDNVYCELYYFSNAVLDSAMSNTITIYHATVISTHVTIALTNGNNPGCPQSLLTFTAIPFNGGTAPTYQWLVNGVDFPGADSVTFTKIFNANDVVTCFMTSNSPCAPVDTTTSNAIPVIHYQITATIAITANPLPACSGKLVIFTTQITDEGGNATLQWYVNNIAVPGATLPTYASSSLNNNDAVMCVLTAPDPCVADHLDTSNIIVVPVGTTLAPAISDSIVLGNNPGCLDSTIIFAGAATNFGTAPLFTWLVNNVATATGAVFNTTSLQNGDVVVLRVNETDGGCYLSDTLFSSPIIMVLDTTPNPPHISLIGNQLITNTPGIFVWYGPNGLISGADSDVYHPLVLGQYYALINNNGCISQPSNIITISLLGVGNYNLDQVKIYPNPTNGKLMLDWGGRAVNMKIDVFSILGQGLLHEEVEGQSTKTLDLSAFAAGNYFLVLKDQDGSTANVKITLTK